MKRLLLASDNCVRMSAKMFLIALLTVAGIANAGSRHRAPSASDDNYTTFRGVAVSGNVTTNDNANGNGPLTVETTPVSNASNGVLVLNSDGSFTYTPTGTFFGVDRFTYRVCDALGACTTGNVMIDVQPARADLVLTQKTNPDTAYVGEPITFTFTFTNNGPSPIYSNEIFYVQEQVPYGLEVQSFTVSEGTYDENSRQWTGFDFPPGKSVNLTMVGVVRPDYTPASITNIITIQPPNNVIVNSTPNSTLEVPVVKRTDLNVTKNDGTEFFTPGSQTTYTMIVSNPGKVNLQRVLIQDNLPAGITSARWTATTTGGATIPNSSGTGTVFQQATMPGGSTVTFLLTFDIPSDYTQQTLINTVTVQTLDENISDPNTANNTASDTDRIRNDYTLNIAKTGPASAVAGSQINYQVVYKNTGQSNLSNANFYDTLDSRLTNVTYTVTANGTASASVSSGSGNPVHFQGSLPADGNSTIVLNVTATISPEATGQLQNFSSVIGTNNKRDVSNTVTTTLQTQSGLSIVKTGPASGTIVAGQAINYTITVTNPGPSNDPQVVISDVIPAVITNVTWTATANGNSSIRTGSPSGGSGNTISTTASIPAGTANTIVINVTGTVLPSATGTITNTATATSTNGKQVASTNNTTITSQPAITIVKSGPATVNAGGNVNYTIVYRNSGPSDAKAVVLTDQIPSQISGVQWTATAAGKAAITSGAAGTGNAVSIIGDLPAGEANTITVNVSGVISPAFTGSIQNSASATVTGLPPFTSNTVITTVVNTTALQISKSGPSTATAGASIRYQVFITNLGPSNAYGVRFRDVVPTQIQSPVMTVAPTGNAVITNNNLQNGIATVTGDIPAGTGNSIVVTITGTIAPSFTGSFQNQASAATNRDSVNSNIVTTTVDNKALPAITKNGPSTGIAGNTIIYSIIATNTGLSDAAGMVITDVVPASITNVTYTTTVNGTAVVTANPAGSGNNISVTGNIPAGSSNSIVINVQGTINKNFSGTILNKSTIALTGKPSASDSVSTVVSRQSAVNISKAGPGSIAAGNSVTYTLLVTNNGPSDAPLVNIFDTIPANLSNVTWRATASNGATVISGATGSGNLLNVTANIPSGAAQVLVTVTGATDPAFTGTLLNTSHAKWNNDSASSQQIVTVVTAATDVNISKIGPAALDAGESISYTVTVNNNGPSTAKAITVNDVIPANISNVTWTVTAAGSAIIDSAASGTGNVVKTKVTIPPGNANKITIKITGQTSSAFVGTLSNAANAVVPGKTPVISDTVKTVVSSHPEMQLTKVGPDSLGAGAAIHYVLTWKNTGTSDALQAVFTDTISAQISNVKWSTQTAAGSTILSGASGTGNIVRITANMAAGNNNTIQVFIDGIVSSSFTGTLANSATAMVPGVDTARSNTRNTVIVNKSDIEISKQGAASLKSGGPVSYVLMVSNNGPSDATGVQIRDVIPAAVTNVSWSATVSGAATITSGATGTGNTISVTGAVPAGAGNTITVTIKGTLDAAYTASSLKNIATAQANGGELAIDSVTATVSVNPGVVILKTAPDSVSAGDPISYNILITNHGPANATNLNIQDIIPAGIDNASWAATISGAGTSVSSSAGTGNINITANIPALPAAAIRIRVSGTVNTSFTGDSIRNIATALVSETGEQLADTVTTYLNRDADLTITKTGPSAIKAGEQISYQIVVGNAGPSLASGVTITDTIPSNLSNITWTVQTAGGATSSVTSGTGNILLTADIPATAGKVTVNVNGSIPATQADTTIMNTAYAKLPSPYINTTAVTSTVQTVVRNEVDLTIVKSGPVIRVAGRAIQYTLKVTNNGPAAAIAAIITDTIPGEIIGVSATASTTGSATAVLQPVASNLVSALVNIPAGTGNSVTITVNGIVDPATPTGPITNTAYVHPGSTNNVINTDDDVSSVTTEIIMITSPAAVVISKSAPATVKVGDPITYNIEVTNNSISNANGIIITDTIPANIINPTYFVTVVGGTGSTTYTDNSTTPGIINLSADIEGTLTGPATVVITVTGTVSQNASGTLVNNAHADFGGRNTATVLTTVNNNTDLQISKSAPQQLEAGMPITYTIAVTNSGPGNATGVTIRDTIPAAVLNPVWQATVTGGATVNNSSGTGSFDITAGIPANTGTVTITVTGTVDPAFTGTILNRAVATPGPGVTDPTPAVATATTQVVKDANLRIIKMGPSRAEAGTTITYELLVQNSGPSASSGAHIFDTIPSVIANTTWTAIASNGAAIVSAASGTGNTVDVTANLPVGSMVRVDITGTVNPEFEGLFANQAALFDGADTLGSNVIFTVVNNSNSVEILKSGPDTVIAGSQIAYDVVFTNNGPSVAAGQITDTLPAGLTNINWMATTTGSAAITAGPASGTSSPVSFSATIPGDGISHVNVHVTATVDSSVLGTLQNFASLTETDKTVNSDTVITIVIGNPELQVVKAGPDTVNAGSSFDYIINVYNTGTADANNVRIHDILPGILTNVTWSAIAEGTATIAGGNIINSTGNPDLIANLPVGSDNRIRIQIAAETPSAASGSFSNNAVANLTASDSTVSNVVTTVISQATDVTISKSGPATAFAGNPVTYQLIIGNDGPSDATAVTVFDQVSDTLQQITWSATASGNASVQGGNLQNQTGPVSFIADIPAGDSNQVIVEINGIVNPDFEGTIRNHATAGNIVSNEVVTAVSRKAAVTITKNGPGSAIAGDKIHYVLEVTNAGPSTSDTLNILDVVPAGVQNITWSATAAGAAQITGPVSGTGNNVNTQAVIPAGSVNSVSVEINGVLNPADLGIITNVATIDTDGLILDQDTTSTIIRRVAALSISKTGPATAIAGNQIMYHVRLVNSGLSEAAGVSFEDIIPNQVLNINWTATAGGISTVNGGKQLSGTSSLISFNADVFTGDSDYIDLEVRGTIDPKFVGTITNTASYSDSSGRTGNSTIQTVVTNQANLTINKIGPATAVAGGGVSYGILVTNIGPSYANDITISEFLPDEIELTNLSTATIGEAFITNRAVGDTVVVMGDIAPGRTNAILLIVTGTVKPGTPDTTIRNLVTETLNMMIVGADSVFTRIEHKTDIRVIKDGPATVTAGEQIQYQVAIRNLGPSAATGVSISDQIPSGLINAIWTAVPKGTGATVSAASGTGNVNITATIPAGDTTGVFVTVKATVDPSFTGDTLINIATADTIKDTVVTTVKKLTGLKISKTGYNQAVAGGSVKYAIIVGNDGPSTAFNVPIKDILPAGIINATWTVTTSGTATASVSNGTGDINITANIPPNNGSVNISIIGKIDPSYTGATITNTAFADTLSSSQPTAILRLMDLAIVKSGPATTVPGATIAYRLAITNSGFSNATNALVEDLLPIQVLNPVAVVRTTGNAGVVSQKIENDVFQAVVNIPAVVTDSVIVDITGTVDPALTGGSFLNSATVKAADGQAEINTANNKSNVTTVVDTSIGINVSKAGPASVNIGDTIRYTMTIGNSGTTTASPVIITDNVPAAIQQVSWTASVQGGTGNTAISQTGGTGNNISLTATIAGSAEGGGTVVINVKGVVTQSAGTTIKNTVTAEYNGTKTSEVTTAVNKSADLVVVKYAPISVNSGDAINFTIVATNNGPADVTGAVLQDIIPLSVTKCTWAVTATGGASSSVQSGSGNNINLLLNIPAGSGAVTINVSGIVNERASGTIANLVTLEPPVGTVDPTKAVSLTNTIINGIPSGSDITVVKSAPEQVNAGDSITYQLNITNTGNSAVDSLGISDVIPTGISGISWTANAVNNATITSGATGTGSLVQIEGQLQVGGLITVFIKGRVDTSFEGVLINAGNANADGKNVTSNTVLTLVNKVVPETDLAIAKSGPLTATIGDTITYKLTLRNLGPLDADSAVVTDNLPTSMKLVDYTVTSVSGGAGNITFSTTANTLAATIGSFPANASAEITLRAVTLQTGQLTNAATITPPAGITDIDNSDNLSFVTTTVNGASETDLAIIKTGPLSVAIDDTITYKLTVRNLGPLGVNNATVTDNLPASLKLVDYVVSSTTGGTGNITFTATGNTIAANIGTFPASGSAEITIRAVAQQLGEVTNTATIAPPAGVTDSVTTNNISELNTFVRGTGKLIIKKEVVTAGPYVPGQLVRYKLTVENPTAFTIEHILVKDKLPARDLLGDPEIVNPNASHDIPTHTIIWNVGVLEAGKSASLEYIARITNEGIIINRANVTALEQSSGLVVTGDSTEATIRAALSADLEITKTINNAPATLQVGDKLTFTITVKNNGPNVARIIGITDSLHVKLELLPDYTANTGKVQTSADSRSFIWAIDSLAANETATLQFSARVIGVGQLFNEASVAALTPDPDLTNNHATTQTLTATGDDIYIPNTITPDGDGKNDHFKIPGITNFPGSVLLIYNRWGNQVYVNKNYANEWDGHNLNEGTYFYILKLNTPQGIRNYKGWILLLR